MHLSYLRHFFGRKLPDGRKADGAPAVGAGIGANC
jgi:hypothetical protein